MKNVIFWVITAVFFVIYFQIFKYTLGGFVPSGATGNMIAVFVIVVVNIPLSVFSAEKIIKVIKQM